MIKSELVLKLYEKYSSLSLSNIEKIIEVLPGIVETLRKISPVNVNMDKLEIQGEKVWAN